MKIFKIINILILITSFILGLLYQELTIALIWSKAHVNSIIGFQQIVEKLVIENNYNLDIWFNIIIPIMDNSIFFIFTLLTLLNLIIYQIKK